MHEHDNDNDNDSDIEHGEGNTPVEVQWWCTSLGNTLIWARVTVFDSGVAEVLAASGEISRYDDEAAVRMALLDAAYYAFDGLDELDAAEMGFDLDFMQVPIADNDEELLPRMSHKIARGIG
jgi:hypothetical protein